MKDKPKLPDDKILHEWLATVAHGVLHREIPFIVVALNVDSLDDAVGQLFDESTDEKKMMGMVRANYSFAGPFKGILTRDQSAALFTEISGVIARHLQRSGKSIVNLPPGSPN